MIIQQHDNYGYLVIGYICSLFSHLYGQPRVDISIERLKFIHKNPNKFVSTVIPMSIYVCKLLVEVSIEILQILATFYINDPVYMVMCFTGFSLISFVDYQYYQYIAHPLKHKMENEYLMRINIQN